MCVREAGLEYREKEVERMNDTPSVRVTREMAFVIARGRSIITFARQIE